MAAASPEIQVFAVFPTNSDLSSWGWVHCLTFPVNILNELQFTPRPYEWIRYATGVVVGAQGDLSLGRDSPHDIVDYNSDFPLESTDLFYHTSDDEKARMFPADPDMDRTSITSSEATPRRAQFRSDIIRRDEVCVLTGFGRRYCDAAHLLPHSKENEYIETYTEHRSRDDDGNDIVREIDDVRNGILLNKNSHVPFGTDVAFLVTPNFAMDSVDVNPVAPPMKRCIAHLFIPNEPEGLGNLTLPSGSLVRMPDTLNEWPPDILFDAVYANTVLHHFASQAIRDTLKRWKSTFYPGRATSAAQASHQAIVKDRVAKGKRKKEQKRAPAARRENRASHAGDDRDDDYFDFLMILPYMFMSPDEQEAAWKKAAEKRVERERGRLEDKIVGWRREVADASP